MVNFCEKRRVKTEHCNNIPTFLQGHRPVPLLGGVEVTHGLPALRQQVPVVDPLVCEAAEPLLPIRALPRARPRLVADQPEEVVRAPLLPLAHALHLLHRADRPRDVRARLVAKDEFGLVAALADGGERVRAEALAARVGEGVAAADGAGVRAGAEAEEGAEGRVGGDLVAEVGGAAGEAGLAEAWERLKKKIIMTLL